MILVRRNTTASSPRSMHRFLALPTPCAQSGSYNRNPSRAGRNRGLFLITISWSSAVRNVISRSTEKPSCAAGDRIVSFLHHLNVRLAITGLIIRRETRNQPLDLRPLLERSLDGLVPFGSAFEGCLIRLFELIETILDQNCDQGLRLGPDRCVHKQQTATEGGCVIPPTL